MIQNEEDKSREQWYSESYKDFVNYFKDKKTLERKDIVFGIAMAYSWMPKIPQTCEIIEIIDLVNDLRINFDKKAFVELKGKINNSTVGTSKLLHFIAPDKYPIWDKKVCTVFYPDDNCTDYFTNQPFRYFRYIEWCNALINNKDQTKYEEKRKEVEKYIKEGYSKLKIIDLYMWKKYKDQDEKKNKKKKLES
jgi:hypothetical protein